MQSLIAHLQNFGEKIPRGSVALFPALAILLILAGASIIQFALPATGFNPDNILVMKAYLPETANPAAKEPAINYIGAATSLPVLGGSAIIPPAQKSDNQCQNKTASNQCKTSDQLKKICLDQAPLLIGDFTAHLTR